MQTITQASPHARARSMPAHTLSSLARESFVSLEAMYAAAQAPSSLTELSGRPKGRMLAVRGLGSSLLFGARLRAFAGSPSFVWDGKSFSAEGPTTGTGINRVRLPGLLGSQQLFPFHTRIGPSRVDGRDAILLDYDLPENPAYIRRIHDEVRPVAQGLYLGPAMWKGRGDVHTVLYFALSCEAAS